MTITVHDFVFPQFIVSSECDFATVTGEPLCTAFMTCQKFDLIIHQLFTSSGKPWRYFPSN